MGNATAWRPNSHQPWLAGTEAEESEGRPWKLSTEEALKLLIMGFFLGETAKLGPKAVGSNQLAGE